MSYENFFRLNSVREPLFFDEGPRIQKIHQINSSAPQNDGMDTTAVDPFRQGIEITQIKHFDAGIAKIHAGEPGHQLRQNGYGMSKNFRPERIFEEIDYFNPVAYLQLQTFEDPSNDINITFPIITSDNDQLENFHLDGVIEPFAIREVSSFFSTEIPFQSRAVRGTLMGGNADQTWASDQVLTVDYVEIRRQQIPFLDMFEMFSFSGSSVPQPMNGFFFFNKSLRDPFDDARYVRNVLPSSSYQSDMNSAMSIMTASSDNYISFKQKSATSGWQYDSVEVGTDSIAFGGLTY